MRRPARIALWGGAGVLVLLALLVAVVLIGGNTEAGRGFIERTVSRLTEDKVRLAGLGGSFPRDLTLRELDLVDDRGVWLSASDIALRWSPLDLLERRIHVDALTVAHVHVERAPVSESSAGGGGTSLPHVDVDRFAIGAVELGAPLVGTPAALSLRGGGTLRSLQQASAHLEAHRLGGAGDYTLELALDAKRIDAALSLHEPAGGPLEALLTLPGLGALRVDAAVHGLRGAEKVRLDAAAGELHAAAAGTLDLVRGAAELDFSATSPALALRPDLGWQKLELKGRWQGPWASADARASLTLDGLHAANQAAAGHVAAELAADGGLLKLAVTAGGVQIPGPSPRLLADDALQVDATVRMQDESRPLDVEVAHRLFKLHAKLLTAADLQGTAELHVPDVAPFARLGGQDVRGTLDAAAQIAGLAPVLSGALQATLNLDGGTETWIPMVGPKLTAQLTGSLSDAAIKIERLRIATAAATVSASAGANRRGARDAAFADTLKDLKAQWEATVSDLHAFSPDAAGTLRATGQLAGDLHSLSTDVKLATSLSIRGSPSGDIEADLHARGIPGTPNGSLQARGNFDGAPLTVDVAAERGEQKTTRILVRQAEWKSAHVDGDLTLGAALAQARGALHLRFGDLSDVDRLAGVDVKGRVDGDASFAPGTGTSQVQVQLEGKDLVIGPVTGGVSLRASGTPNALGLQLSAQFPDLYGAPASLASTATLNSEAHTVNLADLGVQFKGQSMKLLAPAVLNYADGVAVDDLRLGVQQAVLEIKGRLTPELDVRATLAGVGPSLVNAFAPALLADGAIEARARLQGSPSQPTGAVRVDATALRLADPSAAGLPALEFHARSHLADGSASLDARLAAGPALALTAAGTLPLSAAGALDVKLGGKLDLALANPLLEARGLRTAGTVTVDAAVSGTAAAPVFGGTILLAQGNLRDYGRGITLSDINAELGGKDGAVEITRFKAAAGSGTVAMTGRLGLLQPQMPVDLKITATNAQPITSNILTANLNADLSVAGTARQRLDVAGTVHVNRATIGIPNAFPPDVAVLDVRRRGGPVAVTPEQPLVIGVDVKVEAAQQILVEGRGLDAELGGDLHITGTTDALMVSGGFDLQRGTFTLAGSKLNFIQPGKVSFDGAGLRKKIDPTLDFTAQTTVGETTAQLHIGGYADAPQFEFSNPGSPNMPQDEIMALVLFGVPAAQLTALQLAQIGAALATLSGVGGGGDNPLVKLQKSLGLDRLTVGANTTTTATGATESSGASIAAGRYVSKRVYIEGKQTTTGTSQVQVDVDLTKRLKLQTRLGNGTAIQGTTPENDPGSSVGLSYQFEY